MDYLYTFEENTIKVLLSVKLYPDNWESVKQISSLTVIFKTHFLT